MRWTTEPFVRRSTTRSPDSRSETYTREPAMTGAPYTGADQAQCRPDIRTRSALTLPSARHGISTVRPARAAPPKAWQPDRCLIADPTPPKCSCSRYTTPRLPAITIRCSDGTDIGDIEPRSRSRALSSFQVDGANTESRCRRLPDSSVTES